MRLPALIWRIIHRTQNRWHDLLAVLNGYCNHCPRKTDLPGEGGGYRHWRCARRRGHDDLHRYRNYVWDDRGQTTYVPVPSGQRGDQQPPRWERNPTRTLRQTRLARRWQQEQAAKRAAARRAARP